MTTLICFFQDNLWQKTATRRPMILFLIMIPYAWVYMMSNKHDTTLYVGVTTYLSKRVWEHKSKSHPKSFTARYNLNKLVYFEGFDQIAKAIQREKFIKRKSRKWKEALINKVNPTWKDLKEEIIIKFDC